MIKSTDLHNELIVLDTATEKLLVDGKLFESCVVKALTLLIKLLLNVRQNQANSLRHEGIEFIRPKQKHAEH
jgi:hypothetical protein